MVPYALQQTRCFDLRALPMKIRLLAGLISSLMFALATSADDRPGAAVKVMSYNVRYGTAKDGVNHWDKRKEFMLETIQAYDPDLLGTQETLGFQRDYMAEKLAGYDYLGVGRDDGKERGEMMAIYWKTDRFEKKDYGHFWLSETPDQIGSKSWDSSLPRMVTWVTLQDKKRPDAPPILFMNTHFDHRGTEARLESAKLLRKKAVELGRGASVVITGDFNTGEGTEPYTALFDNSDKQLALQDTFRVVNPKPGDQEGTFSGFLANRTRGPRIDWIAVSDEWEVKAAGIDRTQRDGRTPSDHFAITATIQPKGKGR